MLRYANYQIYMFMNINENNLEIREKSLQFNGVYMQKYLHHSYFYPRLLAGVPL